MNWLLSLAAGLALLSFPLARSGYLGLSVRLLGCGFAGVAIARERGLMLSLKDPQLEALQAENAALKAKVGEQTELAKLATIEQLCKVGVGFLVSGSPGAGKTSAACYVIQTLLTDGGSVSVLDIHASDNAERYWKPLGYQDIYGDALACVQALNDAFLEYQRRESGESESRDRLVVLIDEFEEWLGSVELKLGLAGAEPKEIKETLKRVILQVKALATGGA
ncbi:MAG: ATP-binding protein [Spirulinaceae cyanobacterium SM2_1_0]|nr:ATP-binding protein [Spirulinaceae cyanobacterium SM2_1_0]